MTAFSKASFWVLYSRKHEFVMCNVYSAWFIHSHFTVPSLCQLRQTCRSRDLYLGLVFSSELHLVHPSDAEFMWRKIRVHNTRLTLLCGISTGYTCQKPWFIDCYTSIYRCLAASRWRVVSHRQRRRCGIKISVFRGQPTEKSFRLRLLQN